MKVSVLCSDEQYRGFQSDLESSRYFLKDIIVFQSIKSSREVCFEEIKFELNINMNIIGDEISYKCNIFQIMILQLHTMVGTGAAWTLPVYDGKYGDGSDPNSI